MHLILLTVKLPCISVLCPSFSTILKNTYGAPIRLLLLVKVKLYPLKALLRVVHLPWLYMPLLLPHWLTHFVIISRMYLRLGLRMMLLLLDSWYHFYSGGSNFSLWVNSMHGYHPNTAKTYYMLIVVKPQLYDSSKQVFQDTNVQIACHGQRAAIGTRLSILQKSM